MDKLINFPIPRVFRNYPALLKECNRRLRLWRNYVACPKQKPLSSKIPFCAKSRCPCEQCSFRLASRSRSSPIAKRFWTPPTRAGDLRNSVIAAHPATSYRGYSEHFGNCPPAPVVRGQQHLISIVADARNQAICDLKTGFAFAGSQKTHYGTGAMHATTLLRRLLLSLSLPPTRLPSTLPASAGTGGAIVLRPSGAGKSTLAYACARSGWIFTSDDSAYMKHHTVSSASSATRISYVFDPPPRIFFPSSRAEASLLAPKANLRSKYPPRSCLES